MNGIQSSCTSPEGESELVLGHAYGVRQWFVKSTSFDHWLEGHAGMRWKLSTPNEAECSRTKPGALSQSYFTHSVVMAVEHIRRFFDYYRTVQYVLVDFGQRPPGGTNFITVYRYQKIADVQAQMEEILDRGIFLPSILNVHGKTAGDPNHQVVDPSCTCGIYAYTDRLSLEDNSLLTNQLSVFGLIKASGRVTQGPRGFRAQRAEIVALTAPHVLDNDVRESDFIDLNRTDVVTSLPPVQWVPTAPRDFLDILPLDMLYFPDLHSLFAYADPFLKETRA